MQLTGLQVFSAVAPAGVQTEGLIEAEPNCRQLRFS